MIESKSLRRSASFALLLSLAACEQAPTDVREWTPTDHKGETQNPERTGQTPAAPSDAPAGLDEVTLATWSNNCTLCHGQIGRGDGPQAPMTKPRDLTDLQWQAQVTDEQIATTILQGKGLMPKFALPPTTVQSLVQLVRRLAAVSQPQAAGATSASPSPQTAASAAKTPAASTTVPAAPPSSSHASPVQAPAPRPSQY